MTTRTQPIVTAAQLGTLLHGARKSRKLTQAQLAARLGLSQTRMSDLERTPGTLSVDQLLALCGQLGLQLSLQAPEGKTAPRIARNEW
jgi:HTH-type transcriptional regulator/antitoxin HipB